MKKQKSSLWETLKWKWFMFKINIYSKQRELNDKKMRIKYCSKGFHKLKHNILSIGGSNRRTVKVEYLHCRYCKYSFFTTVKQKEKYVKLHNEIHPHWDSVKQTPIISELLNPTGDASKKTRTLKKPKTTGPSERKGKKK